MAVSSEQSEVDFWCVLPAWTNKDSKTNNSICFVDAATAPHSYFDRKRMPETGMWQDCLRFVLHVFLMYCMMLMYDHQLILSKRNAKLLPPHP